MEEKKAGLKYFLFIGIPVLIILIVLGCYYTATNPMTILKRTINSGYNLLEENLQTNDNLKNEFHLDGNLEFKTDADLGELTELQNYNYDFNINYSNKEKFMKITFGMNDKENDILHASIYQIQEKLYLEAPKLFEKLLEIESNEVNNIFTENDINYEIEDIKNILQKIKNTFVDSLDETFLEREKTDIKINDETIKTTKISYLLDRENQERTLKFMIENLMKDEDFLNSYCKTLNIEKEEALKQLEEYENDFEFKEEIEMNLFTEGLSQNVIRLSLISNNDNNFTYINYQNKISIDLEDWHFDINKWNKDDIDVNYSNPIEKITGKLNITSKNDTESEILLEINTPEAKSSINLKLTINNDETINIPDTTNTKKITELTGEEQLKIFENIENVLKDTFFYNLIEQSIM